jgi:hypothetical protein
MNAVFRSLLVLALALLGATPVFAAKSAGKASTPAPSVRLRHLIDNTMPKLGTITNPKQIINEPALTEAQADFAAKAITAPPAQQPMYQAAQNVVANLIGAVEEHNKAVADFHYSKNMHGAQERQNEDISNPQRGWDAGAVARANNAKQNKENADSRKELLDKEKFLSNGTVATWTQRVAQIHEIVEQAYTAELVAEKQLAMVTPATPPPAPKPASQPKEPTAAEQYSPVGPWKPDTAGPRFLNLKEDNTVVGGNGGKFTGTWKWTDQSKGALTVTWTDGITMDLNFSTDGRTLTGKSSRGLTLSYTRRN